MTHDRPEAGTYPGEMHLEFPGELYEWRGPAPYHFIKVPEEECVALREVSPIVSYGWGVIPVRDVVRHAEGLVLGDTVLVELAIGS